MTPPIPTRPDDKLRLVTKNPPETCTYFFCTAFLSIFAVWSYPLLVR